MPHFESCAGVQDRHYVSEEYKKEVLEHMSIHQLIDTILINPTVHISPSYRDTGLSASYTFKPLSNLVYTRDQQVLCLSVLPMKACVSVSGWACFRVLIYRCRASSVSVVTWRPSGLSPRRCEWDLTSALLRRSRHAGAWCPGACVASSASWRSSSCASASGSWVRSLTSPALPTC